MSDDARRILLSRRARFIAAAIAGIGTAVPACKPQVCLEPAYIPEDASTKSDAEAGAPSDGGIQKNDAAEPQPCLSTTPPDPDASDQK